jgi:hypothetical protein
MMLLDDPRPPNNLPTADLLEIGIIKIEARYQTALMLCQVSAQHGELDEKEFRIVAQFPMKQNATRRRISEASIGDTRTPLECAA